ncbi:metal-dependent hydrolase [Microbacterium sp. NPDC019599]|uniref:metal-dependent hydrolase n=1 Tax=Microbacterium sp. NPDC019599 TaxID=3154690 RepID=UPI0033F5DF72
MPLPDVDTHVTYPDGATGSTGTVLHVEPVDGGRAAVLLDTTAFHPVDTAWPDQPADRGALHTADGDRPIVEAVTGGIHEGRLHLGGDLPVRTGTDGWTFVVAHLVEGEPPAVGSTVRVAVDEDHRAALSAGHTACHLASLALDAALAGAWTKPAPVDGLGNPAFDSLAIQSSRITPHGSVDSYRIGKSLRRKGFDPAVLDDLESIATAANAHLADWVAAGGVIRIERTDAALSARRAWVCELPQGTVSIPCGGTHVHDVSDFAAISVSLAVAEVEGGREVTMTTTARMP